MDTLITLILLTAVPIGILAAYRVYRRKKLTEVAAQLGLSFDPLVSLDEELAGLDLVGLGGGHQFENCLSGTTEDTDLKLFEFRFELGTGNHASECSHTVLYLRHQALDLPHFTARPKSLQDRLLQGLGSPISIADDWGAAWNVSGEDPAAVRQLLNDTVQDFLQKNQLWVEGRGQQLLLYRWNYTVNHLLLADFVKTCYEALLLLREAQQPAQGAGIA